MSENQGLNENPYSQVPLTKCPKGGLHRGLILDPCLKCRTLLTYADYEKKPQGLTNGGKTCVIKCIVCGDLREVKPQDAWQVKRCKPCQANKNKKSFTKFIKKVTHDQGRAELEIRRLQNEIEV